MSATLRSLLADDEQAARLRLRRLLAGRAEIEIVGEAQNGLEAVTQIEKLQPDLLFLDVRMPGLDGFEVLRAIAPSVPLPLVIFVTGFDDYALRALQAQALGYLLKPVELEMLDATIERAWSIHAYRAARQEYDGKVRSMAESASQGFGRIVGRKAGRLLLLDPEDVCYFWIDAGIVRARTAEDSFWVNHAIGELETALSAKGFFRAHRSALVNLNKVAEIRPDVRSSFQLLMQDRDRSVIDVSERQARQLRTLIPGL